MVALRHTITAFLGGEINPLLSGRVDIDQYTYGLDLCENFVPINEGPLVKRPGFEFICDADPTSTWLGTFRFSVTQEYAIEWGQLKARFYTNGGRIETSPGVAYEAVTPYAAADAPMLSCQQNYDRLYIDHAGYAPAALARTSAATFSHAALTLRNGPFLDDNSDAASTLSVAGVLTVGGAVTLTATQPIFAAADVGALVRLTAKDFSTIKAWEPGMTGVVAGEVVRSDGKAFTALTSGNTGTIVPTHSEGSAWDGLAKNDVVNAKGPYGVQWDYRHDRYGVVRITGFTSATQVSAEVVRRLPDSLTSVPTWRWAFGAFDARRGWPSIVIKAFGRMLHFKGLDVIGTVAGDFGGGQQNFQQTIDGITTADDLAFRRTLDASDPPLWATADRDQVVFGTATGEHMIGPINAQAAVSGSNIRTVQQSRYGSEAVWPIQSGARTLFVERGGRRIRSANYDFGSDRYVADDLNAASRHITKGGIMQLAMQRLPHALFYGVRGDGQLVVHADTRLELKAFARTVLGGNAKALSAVSIVGADGKTDELWLLVERLRADGATKREIWRQAAWRELGDNQAEQFYVDAGVRTEAAAGQTHFSGLVHLKNQAVHVLANGAFIPGVTVAGDGTLDLPAERVPDLPYVMIVGLPVTARAITTRPETRLQGVGSIQGMLKRVRKAMLRLLETLGMSAGEPEGLKEDLFDRPGDAAMNKPIPLFSGDTDGAIDMDFNRDGKVEFLSDKPLAATITMAMLSLEVETADA